MKGEPTPQRMVHQGYGAVGGVHRANDPHVFRDLETSAINGEQDVFVAVLQQIHQLPKMRKVCAVDLVDDENAGAVSLPRLPAELEEPPWTTEYSKAPVPS